ncbi:hypothetical protein PA598K_04062 [Paenibacillus sp. 598K]|uniref:sugar phosphate isomerase/epimerase family protein n=1 Tax=Paenibacillus sp. 598K TaxID=1117987 RepID=UPI000FF90A81|nr:sugar phosphate isomerase/epimerase [Paenibacillus sp. 598K]GBF75642.1 hypothetical protein PA598K_04062 [Paenibacillus sp. 598K]
MSKMGIGVQMYTVRDAASADMEGTLRQIAEMGYEGVEFAGYAGVPADRMRDLLQELNLKAIGSHVSLDSLINDLQGEIAYLKTIGATYAIIPYVGEEVRESAETWQALFDRMQSIGETMKENGLTLCYHNHAFEFDLKIDGEYVFDAMYSKLDAAVLQCEMDLGWVQYAGEDPLAYIAKYAGRLPLLHLKDFREGPKDQPIDTVELGQGDLSLLPIIEAAGQAGVQWIIVEQDRCANPPLESVRTSREWLKANYN